MKLPQDVVEAADKGRKVEAIKLLCERTGLDLTESERLVDEHLAAQPHALRHARRARRRGIDIVIGLAAGAAVAYLIYRYLF